MHVHFLLYKIYNKNYNFKKKSYVSNIVYFLMFHLLYIMNKSKYITLFDKHKNNILWIIEFRFKNDIIQLNVFNNIFDLLSLIFCM